MSGWVGLDIRHIALAGRDDHPSAANGVHNVARHLVREQRAAGHEARLLLLSHAGCASTDGLEEQAVRIEGLSVRGRTVHLSRPVVEAVLEGADGRTVFHIHGGREPLLVGFARQLRRRGVPYAITVHGRFSHVYDRAGRCRKWSTALYLRLAERGMLAGAHVVQALSEAEAEVIRRIAPNGQIAIVGNGAYSSRLGPALTPPAERARSPAFPHFVFCGRYAVDHKGLDLLLHGFALHVRAGGSGRLTTVGSGPARAWLQALAAELGVADRVEIGGPRFAEERDALLRACDYFVMASRYEGIPLAALEAAAMGLPLIVTAETGLASHACAYGGGFAIEALTAEAVAAALGEAASLDEHAWRKQRASAHELVRVIGDWSTISADLCKLYGSTLPRSSFVQSVTS